ncbi:hypothetical protein ACVJH7_005705 [Bradyrhizobium elkanii]
MQPKSGVCCRHFCPPKRDYREPSLQERSLSSTCCYELISSGLFSPGGRPSHLRDDYLCCGQAYGRLLTHSGHSPFQRARSSPSGLLHGKTARCWEKSRRDSKYGILFRGCFAHIIEVIGNTPNASATNCLRRWPDMPMDSGARETTVHGGRRATAIDYLTVSRSDSRDLEHLVLKAETRSADSLIKGIRRYYTAEW